MGKMSKIIVKVGNYDGSIRNITFTGELLKTQREYDAPNDVSHGTQYDLYRVRKGYRVYERRWMNGSGIKRQNYAKLSKVMSEAELLKEYTLLANYAGIFESVDLDSEE